MPVDWTGFCCLLAFPIVVSAVVFRWLRRWRPHDWNVWLFWVLMASVPASIVILFLYEWVHGRV
jgi:hypothetical protein